jgi:hypothetical protein
MVMDINRGLYSQGFSCLISMGLALYGYIHWGKKAKKEKVDNDTL